MTRAYSVRAAVAACCWLLPVAALAQPATGTVSITDPNGFGPLHDGEVAIQIKKQSVLIGTFAMTIHAVGGGIEHDVNISLTIR